MVCVPLFCFVLLFPLGRRDGDWGGAILMGEGEGEGGKK